MLTYRERKKDQRLKKLLEDTQLAGGRNRMPQAGFQSVSSIAFSMGSLTLLALDETWHREPTVYLPSVCCSHL